MIAIGPSNGQAKQPGLHHECLNMNMDDKIPDMENAGMENDPANDSKSPPAADLEHILKMAWRPAWSMRSRRGSLAPFIDWWKHRKNETN